MADALPPADEYGLLPPGVHPCSWEEFERRYATSPRRRHLLDRLAAYLAAVQARGWDCEAVIDGSFVMEQVAEPNDLDLVLAFPPDWDLAAPLVPADYNLVWGWSVQRDFEIDVFPMKRGSVAFDNMVVFFQGVRLSWKQRFSLPPTIRKGLVRLTTRTTSS